MSQITLLSMAMFAVAFPAADMLRWFTGEEMFLPHEPASGVLALVIALGCVILSIGLGMKARRQAEKIPRRA